MSQHDSDDPGLTIGNGEVTLRRTSGTADLVGFAVLSEDDRIGTVAIERQRVTRGTAPSATMRWNLPQARGEQFAARVLELALGHAFGDLGILRVEARVGAGDHFGIRAASIAGLRHEGIVRGHRGDDRVQLARISEDPSPRSADGFIHILNAGLPRKRVISQGLIRDERNRVLVCELTYKRQWDLPGGVIEGTESPRAGLARELREELGHGFAVGELLTMSWLPPWNGWDDACLFLFDLGHHGEDLVSQLTLQASEIRAVHWCDLGQLRTNATTVAADLVEAVLTASPGPYREAQ